MKHRISQWIALPLAVVIFSVSGFIAAQTPSPPPVIPPNLVTDQAKPMIMLNMSRDHQLFYRAYDEFSDIDGGLPGGDLAPETTYKHSFTYYGYFDSFKCYNYNGTSSRFEPTSVTADKTCTGQAGRWSGNFLNWSTMTKIDIVRKVLYGGLRSTDTTSLTVLERANLPTDAHSFAKHYRGTTTVPVSAVTPFDQTEVTICNTTLGDNNGVNRYSHTNNNPPLLRVARGDYQLWNANERWQCYWSEDKAASNGNSPATTGLNSASSNPGRGTQGLTVGGSGPDFVVRVEACRSALIGNERCKEYGSGGSSSFKPIGLLHEYGEDEKAEFGLLTGSFRKNISGGVVRSNMGSFRDEINTTNGNFSSSARGIVYNIDRLRIYGYDYNDGTYIGADNCSYQITGLTEGECTSWGNPIGEMYLESLRYLAGKTATPAFTYTNSGSKDAAMGLSQPAWVDPMLRGSPTERAATEAKFGRAQCRPINLLTFNASVSSYDHDQWAPFSDLSSTQTVGALVDIIGVEEKIHNKLWFVGGNGGTDPDTDANRLCTSKTVGTLSSVRGICPDGPAYFGSYAMAGLAYWANTNRIRSDITAATDFNRSLMVRSYSVALSQGKPRIVVRNGNNVAVIQPAYRLRINSTRVGSGTLVDFRVVNESATEGRYLVVWEDSEQGGDYDQDASGIIRWKLEGDTLRVFTSTFADATANPQGFGYTISGTNLDGVHFHSGILGFNYNDPTNLPVTRPDGTAHPNVNASGGCKDCRSNQGETMATYTLKGTSGGSLEDPLWYAAKWGGFSGAIDSTSKPTSKASWDIKKIDGTAGEDGIPDNYFFATRPQELENSLRSVFEAIISGSNTAPALSAPQLTVGSARYSVSFDQATGKGEVSAFVIKADGEFNDAPAWTANAKLNPVSASSRVMITNEAQEGKALRWANLSATTKTTAFADVEKRLDWYRGDKADETPAGLRLRARTASGVPWSLGNIVNSNPHVQLRPQAALAGPNFPGYRTFATSTTSKARKPVLWVGSGDGLLYGINASVSIDASTTPPTPDPDGGKVILSYLPQGLHAKIPSWITTGADPVQAQMDGSPFTADVNLAAMSSTSHNWKTYLFSALGRGGKGMFALDVTNPSTFAESAASSIFRWQFNETNDNSGDLGFNVSSATTINPQSGQSGMVALMNNGKFAVLMNNGVRSANASAALYILNAAGPSGTGGAWLSGGANPDFVKLVVPSAGPTSVANGLSEPTWVDVDGNGTADFIYAGDLRGNVWKFDVRDANPANWKVALENLPLFQANSSTTMPVTSANYLPITSTIRLERHPNGGFVAVFGTGQALFSGDFASSSRVDMTFGIWDRPAFSSTTSPMTAAQLGADLGTALPRGLKYLQQRVLARNATTGLGTMSEPTGDTTPGVDWASQAGWYFRFAATTEMNVYSPLYLFDGLMGVNSIAPKGTSSTDCNVSSDGYLTLFDPISGLLPRNVAGKTTVGGVSLNVASVKLKSGDPLRVSWDLTPKNPTIGPGSGGSGSPKDDPCVGPDCKKTDNSTGPSCVASRATLPTSSNLALVQNTSNDSLFAGSSRCRIHWRDVPNFRTTVR